MDAFILLIDLTTCKMSSSFSSLLSDRLRSFRYLLKLLVRQIIPRNSQVMLGFVITMRFIRSSFMYPITVLACNYENILRSSLSDESRSFNLRTKFEIEGFIVVRYYRNSLLEVRNNLFSKKVAAFNLEYEEAKKKNNDITPDARPPTSPIS